MRVLVLFESLFGNTRTIAEAVAAGVREVQPDAAVECRAVDGQVPGGDLDLVVLGAPTHFWGLTASLSRAMESQYERRIAPAVVPAARTAARSSAATTGMRAVLAALPPGCSRAAAAFDTCMTGPLTGGARAAIARRLERAGYRLLAEPETFYVEAVAGPLRTGEVERARAWGATLGRALGGQHTAKRRTTMNEHETDVMTTLDGAGFDRGRVPAPRAPSQASRASRPPADVTRIVTTTEVVVGAVLVARYLSRHPGSSKALVTMGPGGWVSMKGGTVAVRRASRPWGRPTPIRPVSTGGRAPLWARVLSAVPLQALMR